MAEDDVTMKVFENTKACACVDMLIEVDVCKTVVNVFREVRAMDISCFDG